MRATWRTSDARAGRAFNCQAGRDLRLGTLPYIDTCGRDGMKRTARAPVPEFQSERSVKCLMLRFRACQKRMPTSLFALVHDINCYLMLHAT